MRINLILVLSIICLSFYSCSTDDDGGYNKLEDKENKVEYKVYTNSPGIPIRMYGYQGQQPLVIKESWMGEYITKAYGANMRLLCDDPSVLLTGEIYINGKLKIRREGNSTVMMEIKLKK